MSSTILPWRPIFQAWMNKQIKTIRIYIFEILEKHFDELFKLLITKCLPKMKVNACNYIKQIIDLLDGLLNKEIEYTKIFLERLTIFALMWSMGSLLELNDRAKLEQYFIGQSDINIPKNIPQGDSIFDYLVNDNGQWEHWSTRVESWEYPKDEKIDFASILVPNIGNVRILSKQEKAVLLIGEPGTAKTVIITSYLKHYDSEQHLTRIINFSSITTSSLIQKTIENFVDKRVANIFSPLYGRKMTIFIDDINTFTPTECPFNSEFLQWYDCKTSTQLISTLLRMEQSCFITNPNHRFILIIDSSTQVCIDNQANTFYIDERKVSIDSYETS
ncbi:unnamed protein product [Rotaria sp. Silwood2]|nr:unnamed protein product [Rotaria sp. Silwood2]